MMYKPGITLSVCVCVCVFSPHPFWTSSSLDVPAGVTQEEEGHTGFIIHLLSAVRALIFLARRILCGESERKEVYYRRSHNLLSAGKFSQQLHP